jgi:hypothetical protein
MAGAVRFVYVERDDTTIEAIDIDPGAAAAADRLVALAKAGDVVSPPPKGTLFGRIAFVTAVADSIAACHAALDTAEAGITVRARA